MAQTELMLRLIKDGKIVGYKHITPEWDKTLKMGKIEFTEVESLTGFDAGFMLHKWGCIDYDSFELGIKVGDEWWFVGDIDDANSILRYGAYIVKDESCRDTIHTGFYFENPDMKDSKFFTEPFNAKSCILRIGNIHEVEK